MKPVFTAIGKSIAYFVAYLFIQIVTVFVGVIGVTVGALLKNPTQDPALLNAQIISAMSSYALPFQCIGSVLFVLLILCINALHKKNLCENVHLYRFDARHLLSLAILGVSANFALSLLNACFPYPESWVSSYNELISIVEDASPWLLFVSIVIVAPIVEELLFRAIILDRLAKVMPLAAAAVISSLAFGIMHLNPIQTIYTTVFGLLLAFVYIRTSSLLASIYLHMFFNATAFCISMFPLPFAASLVIPLLSIGISGRALQHFCNVSRARKLYKPLPEEFEYY